MDITTTITLPISLEEATRSFLSKLSSRRMRDVLEKRFGLKGGKKKTLEAIGTEYKITRERVRQIENDALKCLAKDDAYLQFKPFFVALEEHVNRFGGVMAEQYLLSAFPDKRSHAELAFLLRVGKQFISLPETDDMHQLWTTDETRAAHVAKIIQSATDDLEKKEHPVTEKELSMIVSKRAGEIIPVSHDEEMIKNYIQISKLIARNPYGEYGLSSWPTIHPRGIKDKAYTVLVRSGHPLHFKEVAVAIDDVRWSKRKAHPRTVHNELIKDSRFVLVGRGYYAIREWGYEPGVVRDVLVSVLKQATLPLSKDEIIKLVMEKRLVKEQTILLNLQNKSLFKRTNDGTYTLV